MCEVHCTAPAGPGAGAAVQPAGQGERSLSAEQGGCGLCSHHR